MMFSENTVYWLNQRRDGNPSCGANLNSELFGGWFIQTDFV